MTSSGVFDKTIDCHIVSIQMSDHRGIFFIDVKFTDIVKGNGYWKFNNSLLCDIEFVNKMNTLIDSFVRDNDLDYQTLWELLNGYSKQKSLERKSTRLQLYNELNDLDTALAADPQCTFTQGKREHTKLKLELLEGHKARAAQVRARAQWVQKGEKNTQFFLNLEKSRVLYRAMYTTEHSWMLLCHLSYVPCFMP